MIIAIPVFPASHAEYARAKRPLEGHAFAAHLALRAKALPGATVFVLVRDPRLGELLAEAGLDVHLVPGAQRVNPGTPLQDGREALQHLLDQGHLELQSPVVLADWRSPLLPLADVRRAHEQAQASPDLLCATLREVKDSPIQYHVPQRILFLEHFVFPEPGPVAQELLGPGGQEKGLGLSRPFYFNWLAHDVNDAGHGLYAAAASRHSPIIRLHPVSLTADAGWPSRWLYYHQGPLLARRLIENPALQGGLKTALPVQAGDVPSPVTVWRNPSDGQVVCRVGQAAFPEGFSLRLWPLCGLAKGPGLEGSSSRAETRPNGCAELRFRGAEDADSLILCLLAEHCGAEYDFTEPVSGGERLWAIDPMTKARIDPKTGVALANRQQFPICLELGGTLVAGRVATILDPACTTSVVPLPLTREHGQDISGEWESHDALTGAGLGERGPEEMAGAAQGETSRAPLLAGLQELGHALSKLRALGGGTAAGFSSLKHRVESLYAAQEALVEEAVWKQYRLNDYVVGHVTRPLCDYNLDIIMDCLGTQVSAMRIALREVAQDYENTLETAGLGGFGRIETPPAPAGKRPETFLRPLKPGAVPPFIPRALASDGVSRLFLSAYPDQGWTGGLYSKDVLSGELTCWGEEKRTYATIWYDKKARLLYAMPRTKDEHRVSGVDVFDESGKCLESVFFQNEKGGPLYAAYRLDGNATSLFFGDALSRSVKVLNKTTLTLERSIRITASDYFTSLCLRDQSLYLSTRHTHLFTRRLLSAVDTTVFSGLHTSFPGHMALDCKDGVFYVLANEHQPHAQERQNQWIKRFDENMTFIDSCRLGRQNVLDLHVMEQARVLAVADYWEGLQLFQIS